MAIDRDILSVLTKIHNTVGKMEKIQSMKKVDESRNRSSINPKDVRAIGKGFEKMNPEIKSLITNYKSQTSTVKTSIEKQREKNRITTDEIRIQQRLIKELEKSVLVLREHNAEVAKNKRLEKKVLEEFSKKLNAVPEILKKEIADVFKKIMSESSTYRQKMDKADDIVKELREIKEAIETGKGDSEIVQALKGIEVQSQLIKENLNEIKKSFKDFKVTEGKNDNKHRDLLEKANSPEGKQELAKSFVAATWGMMKELTLKSASNTQSLLQMGVNRGVGVGEQTDFALTAAGRGLSENELGELLMSQRNYLRVAALKTSGSLKPEDFISSDVYKGLQNTLRTDMGMTDVSARDFSQGLMEIQRSMGLFNDMSSLDKIAKSIDRTSNFTNESQSALKDLAVELSNMNITRLDNMGQVDSVTNLLDEFTELNKVMNLTKDEFKTLYQQMQANRYRSLSSKLSGSIRAQIVGGMANVSSEEQSALSRYEMGDRSDNVVALRQSAMGKIGDYTRSSGLMGVEMAGRIMDFQKVEEAENISLRIEAQKDISKALNENKNAINDLNGSLGSLMDLIVRGRELYRGGTESVVGGAFSGTMSTIGTVVTTLLAQMGISKLLGKGGTRGKPGSTRGKPMATRNPASGVKGGILGKSLSKLPIIGGLIAGGLGVYETSGRTSEDIEQRGGGIVSSLRDALRISAESHADLGNFITGGMFTESGKGLAGYAGEKLAETSAGRGLGDSIGWFVDGIVGIFDDEVKKRRDSYFYGDDITSPTNSLANSPSLWGDMNGMTTSEKLDIMIDHLESINSVTLDQNQRDKIKSATEAKMEWLTKMMGNLDSE